MLEPLLVERMRQRIRVLRLAPRARAATQGTRCPRPRWSGRATRRRPGLRRPRAGRASAPGRAPPRQRRRAPTSRRTRSGSSRSDRRRGRAARGRARPRESTSGRRRAAAPRRVARPARSDRRPILVRARASPTGRRRSPGAPRASTPRASAAGWSPPARTSLRPPRRPRPAPASSGSRAHVLPRVARARESARARRGARGPPGLPRVQRGRAPLPACGAARDSPRPPSVEARRPRHRAGEEIDLVAVLVVRRGGRCPARGPDAPSRRLLSVRDRARARQASRAASASTCSADYRAGRRADPRDRARAGRWRRPRRRPAPLRRAARPQRRRAGS